MFNPVGNCGYRESSIQHLVTGNWYLVSGLSHRALNYELRTQNYRADRRDHLRRGVQKSRIFLNIFERFTSFFKRFQTFLLGFLLPILPKPYKLTHQAPFFA